VSLPIRLLGNTGIGVSCLGLGTVKVGRNQGVKYPSGFELPNDATVQALLEAAQEAGINLLDTAPAYGESETRLGGLIRNRGDWIIASKVGEEFINGESRFDFSAEHTRFSVERSLRRLRTDYLDLVLIHSDGNDMEILRSSDCLETLHKLREEGKIRALGMSTKTVDGALAAIQGCDVLMLTLNPAAQDDLPVIQRAGAEGVGVLIKKAFASGHAGSSTSGFTVQDSLNLALAQNGVSSVIMGTINLQHLLSNVDAAILATSANS
jgi:aryl-alcohol dehydrogenase-like predicted oxidoreductase